MIKLTQQIMKKKLRKNITVWQYLALGYLIVILAGSILLVLPPASSDGRTAGYLNALFTATSATCVTGLSPYTSTADSWSLFGQIVILLLIQTGGLGFMTFVSSIFLMLGRGMGLNGRRAMMASSGARKLSGVSKLVKRIFIGTAACETVGACILSIRFIPDFGAGKGIYYSVWHSVSAFCNAGFDLLGDSSMSAYATDPLVSLTICALILLGGLGFCVWGDVFDCRFNFKKFQLNTKIVLVMSAVLIVVPTALMWLFDWNIEAYSGYNAGQKLLVSLFNAVSPRTAGFYAVAPEALSESSFVLSIVLMFIGGSSGSTAGGIKIGTFAVVLMGMVAAFRGRREINIGKKRLDNSLVSQALAILTACLAIIVVATIIICAVEPNASFKQILYECVSALGTVGLSMSLTPTLGITSKIILILLMYCGRVGILTLAFALAEKRKSSDIRYPVDTLLIG